MDSINYSAQRGTRAESFFTVEPARQLVPGQYWDSADRSAVRHASQIDQRIAT